MSFPAHRPRRLRQNPAWRRLVGETSLSVHDLVYPMFVVAGERESRPVPSMPGVHQFTVEGVVAEAESVSELGISAVLLFGIPASKDPEGMSGYDPEGVVPTAIQAIKRSCPDLLVWADVCLCEYTDHGHCGVFRGPSRDCPSGSRVKVDDRVDNDATLTLLARASRVYAEAGADAVAPSDMMDGRVAAIRHELDEHALEDVPIVAYAAKYSSAYYGPFREAAQSAPAFGDRRGYQMDPANAEEALREVALDLEEGADIVMVKPAGPYLDVVRRVKDTFAVPVAAYQVSGEFSLIKAASERGWVDERSVVLESLIGIKRAGADIVLSYFAKDVARWLKEPSG